MKKQSGFTLIELMVVMAIIAILATAGLAAYTGYIKKARDTTRIADLAAINTIALGTLTTSGGAPTASSLSSAIYAANNNTSLGDPLGTAAACTNGFSAVACSGYYYYATCDSLSGFIVSTVFESKSNVSLYTSDIQTGSGNNNNYYFSVGNCQTQDTAYTALSAS